MIDTLLGDGGIFALLGLAIAAYIIWVSIVVIMDDREPSSSLAWLMFIYLVPFAGLVVYLLIGRNTKVLTTKFKKNLITSTKYLNQRLEPLKIKEKKALTQLSNNVDDQHQRLIKLVSSTSNSTLTMANSVQILQDGKEKFPMLLKDIKEAKDYINMEYFIWGEDDMTREFQDALIKKAEAGVKVKILYDSIGCIGRMSRAYKQKFRQSPVEFHSLLSLNSFINIISAQYRSHNKIAVIDGKIGYTGGMNMGQEYLDGGKKFKSWRDTSVRITGEAVATLQAVFAKSWFESRGKKLGPKYFRYYEAKGKDIVPIQLTYSSPYTRFESIKKTYFEIINCAQKNIYIQSPYFIPDRAMITALQSAALSGVDVKFMITGVPDKKAPLAAAHAYFKQMIEAGVEVYLYQPGFLHGKTIVIDSAVSVVGTANFDIRSFKLDYEVVALMYDQRTAAELEADFKQDLKKCKRYTMDDVKNTSFGRRFIYSVCRLASPLL